LHNKRNCLPTESILPPSYGGAYKAVDLWWGEIEYGNQQQYEQHDSFSPIAVSPACKERSEDKRSNDIESEITFPKVPVVLFTIAAQDATASLSALGICSWYDRVNPVFFHSAVNLLTRYFTLILLGDREKGVPLRISGRMFLCKLSGRRQIKRERVSEKRGLKGGANKGNFRRPAPGL
jgi:hypothetical protein